MRMYIGSVVENFENRSLVKCKVTNIYEPSNDESIIAAPLSRLTRYPIKGDEIILIQPDDDIQLFYYIQSHETDFSDSTSKISIEYKNSMVELNKDGSINITSDSDLSLSSKGSIKLSCKDFTLECENIKKMTASISEVSLKGMTTEITPPPAGSGFSSGYGLGSSSVPSVTGGLKITGASR